MPTPADHAAEFHSLIERYASVVRHARFYGDGNDLSEQEQRARRERLDEVAAILNATQSVHYDVNEAVERWVATHPLSMTGRGMQRVIDQTNGQGNGVTVHVQIGSPSGGGRFYPLYEGQFTTDRGLLMLTLPDSIAEEFRQQGRRALLRDFAALMQVQSDL